MDNKTELLNILRDINSNLIYRKTMGLDRLLIDKETVIENKTTPNKDIPTMASKEKNTVNKLTLEAIREDLGDCTRCKLHETRNKIVFGDGNPNARLVFVGEGPEETRMSRDCLLLGGPGSFLQR